MKNEPKTTIILIMYIACVMYVSQYLFYCITKERYFILVCVFIVGVLLKKANIQLNLRI